MTEAEAEVPEAEEVVRQTNLILTLILTLLTILLEMCPTV